ncbi:hypothetical protein RJ639_021736 [Escallonia herrerae]|uniref:J domain-containing protein n=1 Tax=Escallonia herrerae TaxID=1293975 RepID=A0AA89AFY7_9ASTE|nr:hypothetical protein RJ639_021736 [Escallonia herrerae]
MGVMSSRNITVKLPDSSALDRLLKFDFIYSEAVKFLVAKKENKERRDEGKIMPVATTVSTERGEMVKYYNALSLGLKADIDEIKNAYRKMARYYHPGVCNPSKREESTRMFVELHDAYRTLLDQNLENEETCSTERMSRGRLTRETWESQLFELGNLSRQQKEQKQETWGSRLRSQCKHENKVVDYLPIQNLPKMLDKTSSEISSPLICPRAIAASLKSIVQKSTVDMDKLLKMLVGAQSKF